MAQQQLILNIPADHSATFKRFFWQDNIILRDVLFNSLSQSEPTERFFYLWGEPGCGKSHLLQASCHALGKAMPCAYLPIQSLQEAGAGSEIFDNLEQLDLIAIDGLEHLAGNAVWEEALFHCYNRILAQPNARLMMAASQPIAALNIDLLDLRSRLSACMIFHVASLNETATLKLLQERAIQRGLLLSEEVAHFLIRRCPRNPGLLLDIFEQLDKAAWKEQRRLTIPFVKSVLSL